MKNLMLALVFSCAAVAGRGSEQASPEAGGAHPVSRNMGGRENIEWSMAYSWNMTDKLSTLPRVFLVGDSITAQYSADVRNALKDKMTVSYWASSYCITRPVYRRFLEAYLAEAEYAVVHFHSGAHSFRTDINEWKKSLKDIFLTIRRMQPKARLVWSTCTPLRKPESCEKMKEFNAAAAEVIAEVGVDAVDDQFALVSACDKEEPWTDGVHLKDYVRAEQGRQIAEQCIALMGCRARE